MNSTSRRWLAALLGFFTFPLGMLYARNPGWAAVYLLAALALWLLEFFGLVGWLPPPLPAILQLGLRVGCAVHAQHLVSKLLQNEAERPWYSRWYGLVGVVACFFVLVGGIRAFVAEPFRAASGSMIPTIEPGTNIVAQKWGYGHYDAYGFLILRAPPSSVLKRADILVFKYPITGQGTYVQRLIGLPGDKISYENKRLSINGQPVSVRELKDYWHPDQQRSSQRFAEKIGDVEYEIIQERDAFPTQPHQVMQFAYRENCRVDTTGMACEVPAGHYFVMGDNRDQSADSRIWGFVPSDHIIGPVIKIVR